MANGLATLGVRAGHRVALMFGNDFRFFDSLFGPMRLGAVSVALNTRMGDEALRYVLADCEAGALIASAGMADRARAVAAGVPAVRHLIVDAPPAGAGEVAYAELMAAN